MNSGLLDNALKKLKNIKKKIRHAFLSLSGVFSVLKRGYLPKSIKRAHLAAGIILAFGIIAAGGVFVFSDFNISKAIVDAESLQWTQDAGVGITVPACGSATACGAPGQNVVCTTCSGGAPSVEFTWTDGASTANLACQTVRIGTRITGFPAVRIAGSLPCAGTYTWTGGANATNYNYEVRYHTATKTTCTGGVDPKSGLCLGWTTEIVTYPRDETVCTGGVDPKSGLCLGWTTETNYGHLINEGSFSTPNCTLPPVCSPASVLLNTGQAQTFSVSEGSAPFTWEAPSSSNPSGSGSTHNTSYLSAGPYSVTVIDSLGRTSECSVTVNPPPEPDLVIQSPALSPGSPIVSQSVTFSGTVANTGTGAAGASQARVRVDLNNDGWTAGEPEFTNPTGALGVGGTEAESFAPWTSVLGTHSYQICADKVPDPNGVVAESDEGNNCSAPQAFTVSNPPPQANLIIDSHSAVPPTVISGSSVTISGTVLNIGGASAGSSNTRLRIDIDNNGSWDTIVNAATGILASSASELEQWILPTGSAGPRTYEICADSANAVSELSELDNCVTGIYNVVNTPVLSISLSASPPSPGTAPFSTTLTPEIMSYTGNPSDTINYSLWWNCSQTTTNVGIAEAACGTLPAPSLGNCAENSVGYKCNAVNSTSRSVPHTYATPTGSPFSPKVIIERNGALPKEARIPITVSWPAIGGSCAVPPSADVGDSVTWSASGTGGDGNYTYEWYSMTGSPSPATCAGQPSLACQNFPTSYGTNGTKSGNVRIRSAGLPFYTPPCPSVNISGRIISFGGDPSVIFSGGTADLKWETSGYSNGQCSIDNGIGVANPAAEGSLPTPALTATTIYRITCDDGFGPEFRDATVTVGAPPTFKEIAPN